MKMRTKEIREQIAIRLKEVTRDFIGPCDLWGKACRILAEEMPEKHDWIMSQIDRPDFQETSYELMNRLRSAEIMATLRK